MKKQESKIGFIPRGGQENIWRALEVAQTGSFKVFMFSAGDEEGVSEEQLDFYKKCFPLVSYVGIKAADIILEVTRPSFDSLYGRDIETIADIQLRIDKSKNYDVEHYLDQASQSLLRAAYEKFHFQPYELGGIIKIAATVAAISDSTIIRCEHLAEAIQYRSFDRDHFKAK